MVKTKLSILKRLAVCLGCCGCTEDNPAKTNAEAIDYICEHIGTVASSGVKSITLKVDTDGMLERGIWVDTAGERHSIEIRR